MKMAPMNIFMIGKENPGKMIKSLQMMTMTSSIWNRFRMSFRKMNNSMMLRASNTQTSKI